MLDPDGPTLVTSFIIALGAGIFLRLVAKEKRRRERYLEVRLEEKVRELDHEERRSRERSETEQLTQASQGDDEEVIELQPVDAAPN